MAGRVVERPPQHGGDDSVSRLKELFPEVDPDVCSVILQENNGDIESAVNQLLQLTDPSYRPDDDQPPPRSSPGADRSSETAAQVLQDEEYAARLQQEEETELQRAAEERQATNAHQQHQEQPDVPLVDQLSALADSAKSKFTSFVDRLKAKPAGDNGRPPSADTRSPLYTTLPEDDDALFVVGTPEPAGSSRTGEADEDDAPLERRQHARNQQQQQH